MVHMGQEATEPSPRSTVDDAAKIEAEGFKGDANSAFKGMNLFEL
jgi:hypothetical protein